MAATKRHVNWESVTHSTAVTGVQSVEIDWRGSVLSHSGDDETMPTVKFKDYEDPQVVVTHRDLAWQNAKACGTKADLVCVHLDADGTSKYTATLDEAILVTKSTTGGHRQWGEGRLVFEGISTDGVTNPLTFS